MPTPARVIIPFLRPSLTCCVTVCDTSCVSADSLEDIAWARQKSELPVNKFTRFVLVKESSFLLCNWNTLIGDMNRKLCWKTPPEEKTLVLRAAVIFWPLTCHNIQDFTFANRLQYSPAWGKFCQSCKDLPVRRFHSDQGTPSPMLIHKLHKQWTSEAHLFKPIINRCFLLLLSSGLQLIQAVDQVNDSPQGKWNLWGC